MNLFYGELLNDEDLDDRIKTLEQKIYNTLRDRQLESNLVIDSCNRLSNEFDREKYIDMLADLGIVGSRADEYINDAVEFLSKDYLTEKLERELGNCHNIKRRSIPVGYEMEVTEKYMGLGVLFHIAAGNMDGLPVYTVIEGLLTGNINILKLPSREDGGLTVEILKDLIEIEPSLREYIYVFDYSSKDLEQMEYIAKLSDAIVVWGGDDAINAVRKLASPNTMIVEWGNKISFAYVSGKHTKEDLIGIAENICETNQLFCSSCQGVYLDTNSMEELKRFGEEFATVLEEVSSRIKAEQGIGVKSKLGLSIYSESLENIFNDDKIIYNENSSLRIYEDKILSTSMQYRNTWIRRLPSTDIISTLKPYKNYLQTVGLVSDNFKLHSDLLLRAGAVRITDGHHMSKMHRGQPHDGVYPLRRYTKVVACERKID